MKKSLFIVGVIVIVTSLLKGTIYRTVIDYKVVGSHNRMRITEPTLLEYIKKSDSGSCQDVQSIASLAGEITSAILTFSFEPSSRDPNILIRTKKSNCHLENRVMVRD